jgi:DNA ligase (NAD+)
MTGKLSKPRNEIIDFIESNGGKVSSTVTKNVTYLVTDDPNSGSSKNEKAKKLGVSVVSEEELMELAR